MKSGELLAIGGAYVDINALDYPLPSGGLQTETETVGGRYVLEPGGSAVNFARLCSSLELPTAFVGKVGDDVLGKTLAGLLEQVGVEPLLVVSQSESTNIGFNMTSPAGETIMTVVGTANQSLTSEEVYARASERLTDSKYLFIGGCFKLKRLLPAFVELAADAKKRGVKVILDHARLNLGVTEEDKRIVRDLALAVDFYLPSADEFMELWDATSIEDGLQLMHQQAAGLTIVKNGKNGAVAFVDNEVISVPAYDVKPIHTVGAGDSFNAGFIAGLAKGQTPATAMQFGCATAALKISQTSLPTYETVKALLAAQTPR